MSYRDKMLSDGICNAVITIKARQLLGLVCIAGGAECPLIKKEKAFDILAKMKSNPTLTIRLESDVDRIPHFTQLSDSELQTIDKNDVFNRKRDLDVLQKLGLIPGAIRRARFLIERLFATIETPCEICSYKTSQWKGCNQAESGYYEEICAKGWSEIVYSRPELEKTQARVESVTRIENDKGIFMRPHHLMCLCCFAGLETTNSIRNDTLAEIYARIKKDPQLKITLIEGACEACFCCDGFHPSTGRCVHSCGLIRDYKKDLDLFQKLGLMPGVTLTAKELYALIFEKVSPTKEICGYGDGVVRSPEWTICGDPEGSSGYGNMRKNWKL